LCDIVINKNQGFTRLSTANKEIDLQNIHNCNVTPDDGIIFGNTFISIVLFIILNLVNT
jgi:hypothetical protein